MASLELERSCGAVSQEVEDQKCVSDLSKVRNRKKRSRRRRKLVPKFRCFTPGKEIGDVAAGDSNGHRSLDLGPDCGPTHLAILVNGIIGSAQNWRFAAKQFLKKYPQDVIVHCSESNSKMLTFDGVDVMGERLAAEVISVIKRYSGLQKISFIGHSLGGLVARYAIARLYGRDGSGNPSPEEKLSGKIAGLEPINFITSATPHLGSRGHKQVPIFCGFYTLEWVASHASWFLGKTGKYLFLTDRSNGKSPLLLQMVNDTEDLQFLSALMSFRRRVAYANARFDLIVGWSTSSLRHRRELPKRRHLLKHEKFPHIRNVGIAQIAGPQREVNSEAEANACTIVDMEEAMLRGLTKMSWERVDVNFSGSTQRFFAHNTIQVTNYCINSDGADVIQHIVDNFIL